MSCQSAFFGLFTVNSTDCGANKVSVNNGIYNQLDNFFSQNVNNYANTVVRQANTIFVENETGATFNCNLSQTNNADVTVVTSIKAEQIANISNEISNTVRADISQKQEQAIVKALEGDGKANIVDIENSLKNLISNTVSQTLNNISNTVIDQGNTITIKNKGNFTCGPGGINQSNITKLQVQQVVDAIQNALASNSVINSIATTVSQTNESGLANIIKTLILAGAGVALIGGIGYMIYSSKNKKE